MVFPARRLETIACLLFFSVIDEGMGVGKDWMRSSLKLKAGEYIEATLSSEAKGVRLEFKNQQSGEWEVQNTGYLPDEQRGKVYFQLPFDVERSKVRLKWTDSRSVPFPFFQGRSAFSSRYADVGVESQLRMVFGTNESASEAIDASSDDGMEKVLESDLWRIIGNELYFFNHMRGLQIADLSIPNYPKVVSRYRLPASGEQMYVSENGKTIFLITRKSHQNWPYDSEIRILEKNKDTITEITSISLPGIYKESRMIDQKLYILTERWEEEKLSFNNLSFSYSCRLSTFDLQDPENPVALDQQVIPGAPLVITATNTNLMVVTRDPADYQNKHVVRVFDFSNSEGKPRKIATIRPGGRVLDKFKLRVNKGIITIISQAYFDNSWSGRYTLLENFNLTNGERIGSLELAERETLYATRFHGDYAYIVTFLQTDPLFIIDLSDPASPEIVSELIVPGWSEYLEVMDDQLFAVGVESNQVTASLFDVSDKRNPMLTDRVYMGEEGKHSWSEANYDEKAIGQLSGLNVFLIPYQTWENGKYSNKVQILELSDSGLVKKGSISHRFQARRASPDQTGLRIFSISGKELQVTNFFNRERPEPLAQLPLSWKVDRIHGLQDHIFQLEESGRSNWRWDWSNSESNATLRIADVENPDELRTLLDLGSGSMVGNHLHDMVLHILMLDDGLLTAKAFSLQDKGKIKQIGEISVESEINPQLVELTAFAMDNDTLCWASRSKSTYMSPYLRRMTAMEEIYPYPGYDSESREVQIFSFERTFDHLKFVHESKVNLSLPYAVEWSEPLLSNDQLLYGSKQTTHSYDSRETWRIIRSEVNSSLHRIDLSQVNSPKITKTLTAPGLLAGIEQLSPNGRESILFFESMNSSLGDFQPMTRKYTEEKEGKYGRSLTACAFDGFNLYYLDELEIPSLNLPLSFSQKQVFISKAKENGRGLAGFAIDDSGLFFQKSNLFDDLQVLDLASNGSYVLSKSAHGMNFAKIDETGNPIEWPQFRLSGNLHPDLKEFIVFKEYAFLPCGDYGVETFDLSLPQQETARRTSELVIEDENGNWFELDERNLMVFEAEEVPVAFSNSNAAGWVFRPDSIIDRNAHELVAQWKELAWFGTFFSRGYPWVYHQQLKWLHFTELQDSAWMWSPIWGWLWTNPEIFPYVFHDANESWKYLELEKFYPLVRVYDFNSRTWSESLI